MVKLLWVLVCFAVCACDGTESMPSTVGGSGGGAGSGGSGGVGGVGGVGGAGGDAGDGGSGGNGGSAGAGGDAGQAGDAGTGGDSGSSGTGGVGGGSSANVRMNELQVAGTHNSYHMKPAIVFHPSHDYTHRPLDEQLQGGVRALELDIHQGPSGREIYHIAGIDPNTTCLQFSQCLSVIRTWSVANPTHTPIFVWLEIKDDTGGSPITDLLGVEADINAAFPSDALITPAWLKGNHDSLRARIDADGWPLLSEVQGRVMFIVLNRDEHAQEYTHDFTHLDDRIMFANATAAQLDLPWVVVTKLEGDLAQTPIAMAHERNLLTATNVCTVDKSDAECAMRNTLAVDNGFHMLKDDLPFAINGRSYVLTLPNGSPGCNPVTASDACNAANL